jgi:hypothetical protein
MKDLLVTTAIRKQFGSDEQTKTKTKKPTKKPQ